MKSFFLALVALAVAALPVSSAHADTFDFSFTGPFFSGAGTFTATPDGGSDYLITAVTGEVSGIDIASILAPGTYPTGFLQVPNDNILIYPPQFFGTKYFDNAGVSFVLDDGIDVNLNDTFLIENAVAGPGNSTEFDSVSVSPGLAPTPEPSSLLLLGTGILGFAGVMRRRLTA